MKTFVLLILISLTALTFPTLSTSAELNHLRVSQNDEPVEDESAASDDLGDDEAADDTEDAPLDTVSEGEKIPPAAAAPPPAEAPKADVTATPEPPAPRPVSSAPSTPVVVPKILSSPNKTAKKTDKKSAQPKKFVGHKTVKAPCSMRESADSASKEVGKAKSGSKIWVEEVNESWFKVYRKAGTAFVNTDCLN